MKKCRNWFEELSQRIDTCGDDYEALHRVANKIAWCRRFGHLSETETAELCNRIIELLDVQRALMGN